MKILQICSDYAGQELYSQMIVNLDRYNINNFVYVPVRKKKLIGANELPGLDKVKFTYSYILRKYHRILFYNKIFKITKDIEKTNWIENVNLMHAHFLFSDGAVAFYLKKRYGIPFIVTVRNTDIDIFFKYLIHLRKIGNRILNEAEQIILVTPRYKELLLDKYVNNIYKKKILKKIKIIPNGVNTFWLNNKRSDINKNRDFIRLLYVGKFIKRKNVDNIIKVVEKLDSMGEDVHLTLVGGGGNRSDRIERIAHKNPKLVTYLGKIKDKERLLQIYRENDIFIMPSDHETFGIVYIEAMSQGLPCIYTSGQGIDGYFQDGQIGYSVDPYDIDDIVKKVMRIKERYIEISRRCNKEVERFDWKVICKKLFQIYENAAA